ncbi:MAG: hypothetical protein Q9159_007605, partial [Coniocarpon cinnabarinum]
IPPSFTSIMHAITFATLTILAAFTLINSVAEAGFSTTSWYFNLPENSTARITDVCTTMQVPQLPNDTNGLYLWPGLSNPEQYMAQYVVASDQAFSTPDFEALSKIPEYRIYRKVANLKDIRAGRNQASE